jgi:hypothetical protein
MKPTEWNHLFQSTGYANDYSDILLHRRQNGNTLILDNLQISKLRIRNEIQLIAKRMTFCISIAGNRVVSHIPKFGDASKSRLGDAVVSHWRCIISFRDAHPPALTSTAPTVDAASLNYGIYHTYNFKEYATILLKICLNRSN